MIKMDIVIYAEFDLPLMWNVRAWNDIIFNLHAFELQSGEKYGHYYVCLLLVTNQSANYDESCIFFISKQ